MSPSPILPGSLAGPVAPAGDIGLRHDIQMLADYGAITSPTLAWPMAWDAILADLEAAGYLSHERIGRRNHYRVKPGETFRHPHEQGVEIGLLLGLFADLSAEGATDERRKQV